MKQEGSQATFIGLRTPTNYLAIPDAIRASFRRDGVSPRTDLLVRKTPVVVDCRGAVGTIERVIPPTDLWFDEVNGVTNRPAVVDTGYIWRDGRGRRFLCFADELVTP